MIGGLIALQYCMGSSIHQHASAISIMSHPSWTSLSCPTHPLSRSSRRALVWKFPESFIKFPCDLFHTCSGISSSHLAQVSMGKDTVTGRKHGWEKHSDASAVCHIFLEGRQTLPQELRTRTWGSDNRTTPVFCCVCLFVFIDPEMRFFSKCLMLKVSIQRTMRAGLGGLKQAVNDLCCQQSVSSQGL